MAVPLYMPRSVRAQCPNCGMPITVELHTIIDGAKQPDLKEQLLGGRLNLATCSACRHSGVMSAPLLYHDGEKEFLGVFLPQQLEVTEAERQRTIGEMTTTLMQSLPPEQRKGYLFQPKQFLSMPSMLDAILIADGVTPEQLQKQRAQLRLIQRLLDAQGSDDVLQTIVKEQDEALDYEFFALLSALAEGTLKDGRETEGRQILALRDKLLDMSSWGSKAGPEREILEQLGSVTTPEQLVDKMIETKDEDLEPLVQLVRPALDYGFFQLLTGRIDAAAKDGQKDEARRLKALRTRILDLTDKLDRMFEKEAKRASALLRKLLESTDVRASVREHKEEIDDVVLAVLSMNLQEAEKAGAKEASARLEQIWRAITEMLEESMPPEVRFINHLLDADFPQGTQHLLESNPQRVNGALLKAMAAISADLEAQGRSELAKRMRDIRGQAVLLA